MASVCAIQVSYHHLPSPHAADLTRKTWISVVSSVLTSAFPHLTLSSCSGASSNGVSPSSLLSQSQALILYFRDQVPCQTPAPRTHTHRQALPRSLPRFALWHRLRYRLRKQAGSGKHAFAHVLRYDRSYTNTHPRPIP